MAKVVGSFVGGQVENAAVKGEEMITCLREKILEGALEVRGYDQDSEDFREPVTVSPPVDRYESE